MLFSTIAALVRKGVKLNFTVEACGEEQIEVTVTPVAADTSNNKSGVSLVPKSFRATPAEFDAEFTDVIAKFATATLSLQEQVEAANQLIASAAKQAAETAVKEAAKPATKPAGASKPTPRPAVKTANKPTPELLGDDGDGDGEDGDSAADADADAQTDSTDASTPTAAPAPAAGGTLELTL